MKLSWITQRKIIPLLGWFLFGVVLVGIDQWSKSVFITRVCNEGHAFGWNISSDVWWWGALVCCAWLVWREYGREQVLFVAFFSIVLGGIGNSIDRVYIGCVRDIFSFFSWFSWNVADGAIVLGCILLIWEYLKRAILKET